MLKENLGKDLTKITMPVYFNEPLSMLQRGIEVMEYKDILRKANNCEDELLRIGYIISAFTLVFSTSIGRVKKPFNPLKGETYEYVDGDFKLIVE